MKGKGFRRSGQSGEEKNQHIGASLERECAPETAGARPSCSLRPTGARCKVQGSERGLRGGARDLKQSLHKSVKAPKQMQELTSVSRMR